MANNDPHLTIVHGANDAAGTEKWAVRVRRDAKGLAGQLDEGYIELARLLYMIYDTPIDGDPKNPPMYTKWGYSTFNDYVESELQIHRKKAQRLRQVWYHLEVRLKDHLDVETKKRLVALGFSKVRELARVLTPKNVDKWIEKATELSYPKLCTTIQKYESEAERRTTAREEEPRTASDEGEYTSESSGEYIADVQAGTPAAEQEVPVPEYSGDDLRPLRFSVYPEQREIIEKALERAEQLSNSDIKSNNLYLICMDFLATNDFEKASAKQKLRYIAKLETLLGFKLVAFDGDDVVYGITTLQKVAGSE